MRFLAVQIFENRLRFDEVTESLKVGTFLRHSVVACLVRITLLLLKFQKNTVQHKNNVDKFYAV